MDNAVLVGLGAILITIVAGFGTTMMKLGRIEQQIAVVWGWYLDEMRTGRRYGRRQGEQDTADDRED